MVVGKTMGNIIHKIKRKIERSINQTHVNDFDETSHGWEKYKGNPVLGNEDTGSLFDPFVRRVDSEYVMCVSQRKGNCLMMYVSTDGILWKDGNTVLSGIMGSSWEKRVNRSCFVIRDGVWYLWYTGQNDHESRIGLATSRDGIHFERYRRNPVIVPEKEFEGKAVMNPCVLWDSESRLYRMWYTAGENYEPDVLCYAESPDGVSWKKNTESIMGADRKNPYKRHKVGACDVVKTDGGYVMAYIAYQNLDVCRIALAASADGIHGWDDIYEEPVIGPREGKWDGHAVYKPTICMGEEVICLWYNGRSGTLERIGMATCRR